MLFCKTNATLLPLPANVNVDVKACTFNGVRKMTAAPSCPELAGIRFNAVPTSTGLTALTLKTCRVIDVPASATEHGTPPPVVLNPVPGGS